MTETVGRPAYQQVADDLRRRIAAAELPVGSAIPSTAKLSQAYGISVTVVRAAVAQLRADGLVVGQPGKGVFVRATPEAVARQAVSIEDLSEQIGQLRDELQEALAARREDTAELAALRQQVSSIEAHLAGLYAQLGRPYPGDGPATAQDAKRTVGGNSGT